MKTIKESADILNSDPSRSTHESCFARINYDHENLCAKFMHKKKDFKRQFFHMYGARLAKMKQTAIAKAVEAWGQDVPVKKLADLQDDSGKRCIIVGTLFKHQELKPSILKEISQEFQLIPQQKQTRLFSDNDELILEDELQRIKLIGNIDVQTSVTGIVCAVIGTQDENGKFVVEDSCWAGPLSVPPPRQPLPQDKFVLLVSGFDFAHNADLMPVKLLVDFATGWLGDPLLQSKSSQIALVIIAGNTFRRTDPGQDGTVVNTEVSSAVDPATTLKQVDEFLLQLVESVDVDLMPGSCDPTNYQLPQQPLHLAMFHQAGKLKSLRSVTNPYECRVDGRLVFGSSGQPVEDVLRYASVDGALAALEATLKWGHVAPTAPDTLASYPFYDDDPFVMDCQPDVFFAANQESFDTKLVELNPGSDKAYSTRLICIPDFSKTGTCVLLNLNNLDCQPVSFPVNSLLSI